MKIQKQWKEDLLNNKITFEEDPVELKKYIPGSIKITDTGEGLEVSILNDDGNYIQVSNLIQMLPGDTITLNGLKILIEVDLKVTQNREIEYVH